MTAKYSDSQVTDTAEDIVASRGDYVYAPVSETSGCTYWGSAANPDGPGCFIGELLYRLGESGQLLNAADANPNCSPVRLNPLFDGLFSEWMRERLELVQEHQDAGATWLSAWLNSGRAQL